MNADLIVQTSGTAITSAVISGTYTIGKTSLIPLFNAHVRGLPVVIIAQGNVYDSKAPLAQLVVAKDSTIASATDLNGKPIGVPALNDVTNVTTNAWVDQNGGDWRTLRYVELSQPAAVAAIATHRLDAALLVYPVLASAISNGKVRILAPVYSAVASSFLTSAWFTTKEWTASNRQSVLTFAKIVTEAASYTNAHHDLTAPMLADFSQVPLNVVQHMTRAIAGTTLRAADIAPLLNATVKYKEVPKAFPLDELIDPDVLKD